MNKKTIAIFAVSMVLVCALSVFTTLALLTSQTGVVTNTFTSGNVKITLDEAKVVDGVVDDNADRVQSNEYKFTPNAELPKDPTIKVVSGSEACYVAALVEFVDVPAVTGADLIAEYGISTQIGTANAYQLLGTVTSKDVVVSEEGAAETETAKLYSAKYIIYYNAAQSAGAELELFSTITTPDVGNDALTAVTNNAATNIKITGYAVQSDNNDADTALAALQAAFTDLQ